MAKLLDLQGGAGEEFADHQAIAPWAKEAVEAVRAAGIMGGYPDGTFRPTNSITRAETVVTLQKALEVKEPGKEFEKVFDQAGVYGPEEGREVIEGDAAVTAPGVTLRNITITGDLLLAEGIGEGDVTLKGVTVLGETIVRGGGSNSINIQDSNLAHLTVTKEGVRIVASGSTRVTVTTVESGAILVSVVDDETGGFQNVIISEEIAPQEKITLEGDFAEVNVKGAVSELEIADGNVKEINIEAPVKVTGEGTITTANIEVNGVEIEQKPKKTNISEGVTATVAGEEVKGDKTPSLGGGGGGGKTTISVSAISVQGVARVGEELTATPTPSGATVSYQWQIADAEDGTYTNITGATSSIYKLVSADLGKYIKVRATGTGDYKGTVESKPVGPVAAATLSMADPSEDVIGTVGWTRFAGTVEVAEDVDVEGIKAYYIFEIEGDLATGTVPQYYHYETEEWLNFADLGEGKYRFGPEGGFPLTAGLPLKGQTEFQVKFEDGITVTAYLVDASTEEIISNVIEETLGAKPTLAATISMVDPSDVIGTVGWTRFAGTVKVAEGAEGIKAYYIFEITEGNLAEDTVPQYWDYQAESWKDFAVEEGNKYRFGPSSGFDLSTVDGAKTEFQANIQGDSVTGKAYLVDADTGAVISNIVEETIKADSAAVSIEDEEGTNVQMMQVPVIEEDCVEGEETSKEMGTETEVTTEDPAENGAEAIVDEEVEDGVDEKQLIEEEEIKTEVEDKEDVAEEEDAA